MQKKPWILENGGRQLEAFLGSRGMKTSDIRTSEELIQTAAGVFEIPMQTTCEKMAESIAALPKAARRAMANKNIGPMPRHRRANRTDKPQKAALDVLAGELGVRAPHLKIALKTLCDRQEAIENAGGKSLAERAQSAALGWRR
jgi:hypothetical protein